MWVLFETVYSPLNGLWRIYLYGGLLLLSWFSYLHSKPFGDSPLQAPEVLRASSQLFFDPPGLMKWLPRGMLQLRWVFIVRNVVLIAWIACILGLGGQWSAWIVGVGVLFLHGVLSGVLGTNHRWMLPVYVLLAASLVNLNSSYSLDAWIAERYAGYWFAPDTDGIASTGMLRFLTLLLVVFTLFSGGVSKLRYAGLRWMDGESLRFFISRPDAGACSWLKNRLKNSPRSCRWLSIATIVLELGSPLALLYDQALIPLIVGALLFHLGIWLTMNPNYLPQSWCYLLCLNGMGDLSVSSASASAFQCPSNTALLLLVILVVILVIVALRGIEWWPLTCIPMYGFYRGPYQQWSFEHVLDLPQMHQLGLEYRKSRLPYPISWSEKWVAVQVKSKEGKTRELRPHNVRKKHWFRTLHRVAAMDFALKANDPYHD
ncbi:MAG: hypothetical protein ACM32O_05350, partial [Clostridia bacterium]